MAIFTSLSNLGKDPHNSFSIKTNKILYDLSLYYIKEIDSVLPCVCLVIDHRRRQNVVRTSVTHSSNATFLFLPHFDVICNLLLNRRSQHGIYLLNGCTLEVLFYVLNFGNRLQQASSLLLINYVLNLVSVNEASLQVQKIRGELRKQNIAASSLASVSHFIGNWE